MTMSTVDKVGNCSSYINLSQLYAGIRRKRHKKFIQHIIEKQDDINYQIPETVLLKLHRPELIGSTVLHLAFSEDNFESFNLLLNYGADCYIKNYKQMTVIRRAIEENFKKREVLKLRYRFNEYGKDFEIDEINGFVVMQRIIEGENFNKHDNWRLWGKVDDKYVNSIVKACLAIKNMANSTEDSEISYLHAACLMNNKEVFDFLLKNGADVHQVSLSPIFDSFTPLHFAVKYSSVKMVKKLLDNDASLLANDKFMSPVDMLIDQNMKIIEWLHAKNKLPYKNSLLDYIENEEKLISIINANVGTETTSFHIACTLLNISSLQINSPNRGLLTLDKFLDDDQCHVHDNVLSNSIVSPLAENTALHLVAFLNIETAKSMISRGADLEVKNKNGITAMDILATRATIDDLHFILSHKESWKCITLSDGKTKLLDLISSMTDLDTFNSFLNEIDINLSVPKDAPLWPGYRILHLVVTFSETVKKIEFLKNITGSDKSNLNVEYENCCQEQEKLYRDRIELCLIKNADVTIQDAHGRTPINLAFRLRKTEAVNLMLRNHDKTINPTDEDHLSHLHIACLTNNDSLVEKLLSNGADINAAVKSNFKWHCDYHSCTSTDVFDLIGSTPLHLGVSSGNIDLMKMLLANGADVNAKDATGLTPLHRIFILQRLWDIGNELFKVPKTVNYICRRGRRIGIPCLSGAVDTLRNMSNEFLSSPNLKESIVDDCGFSHLFIAVYENNVEAAKKLLDLGADIDQMIKFAKKLDANNPLLVLSRYDGWTPLHISRERYVPEPEKLLLEHGADILVSIPNVMNPLFHNLQVSYPKNIELILDALKENEVLRQRLQDEFGWTILHVACQRVDLELANVAFSLGVNVNLRTNEDSPMHPGCTALHMLMMNCHKAVESDEMEIQHESIMSSLLANGADVLLTDAFGSSSLHRSDFIYGCMLRSYAESTYTGRILEHVKDYSVNPINHEGISAFHIACIRHNITAVRQFLDHGVDVNQPVEFFSLYLAGCTPLHLAAKFRSESASKDLELQIQSIALLLERGADVNAVDSYGDTPLHVAAECDPPRHDILDMIVRHGANVKAKNVEGKTPLESLLSSRSPTSQELKIFLDRGCCMNVCNEITQSGYLAFLPSSRKHTKNDTFEELALSCPSIDELDCNGRTALHNVVSTTDSRYDDDHAVIGYFVERGCDIDHRDNLGMTALHLAARFCNYDGVEGLLMYGADVNIIDSTGKTAYAYTLESETLCDLIDVGVHNHHLVIESLTRFIYHMNCRGLYLNDVNKQALIRAFSEFSIRQGEIEEDYNNIKGVKIGNTAFVLNDFLSETNAIVYYSKIPVEDRHVIEQFFKTTVAEHRYHHWTFLCKLQYWKALQRADIVENAKDAMNIILDFPLPDLCFDVIEKFLSNADLKNLILAADS